MFAATCVARRRETGRGVRRRATEDRAAGVAAVGQYVAACRDVVKGFEVRRQTGQDVRFARVARAGAYDHAEHRLQKLRSGRG
jgi:hypothetical protein